MPTISRRTYLNDGVLSGAAAVPASPLLAQSSDWQNVATIILSGNLMDTDLYIEEAVRWNIN